MCFISTIIFIFKVYLVDSSSWLLVLASCFQYFLLPFEDIHYTYSIIVLSGLVGLPLHKGAYVMALVFLRSLIFPEVMFCQDYHLNGIVMCTWGKGKSLDPVPFKWTRVSCVIILAQSSTICFFPLGNPYSQGSSQYLHH